MDHIDDYLFDGVHVLVADIFTGAIWRVDTRDQAVTRVHQHEFGVNAARLRDWLMGL